MMNGGIVYHSLADLYPQFTGRGGPLATGDRTTPEAEERAAYGEVRGGAGSGLAFTHVDFWRLLGWVAVIAVILLIVGIVT